MDRDRRNYILLTVALLVVQFGMFVSSGDWVLAITTIIAAVVSYVSYLGWRLYKKRALRSEK
jgi:uncharacterized membrane protein